MAYVFDAPLNPNKQAKPLVLRSTYSRECLTFVFLKLQERRPIQKEDLLRRLCKIYLETILPGSGAVSFFFSEFAACHPLFRSSKVHRRVIIEYVVVQSGLCCCILCVSFGRPHIFKFAAIYLLIAWHLAATCSTIKLTSFATLWRSMTGCFLVGRGGAGVAPASASALSFMKWTAASAASC